MLQLQRTTACNSSTSTRTKPVCRRTVRWGSSCLWAPRVRWQVGCATSDRERISKQCGSYFSWTFFRSSSKMMWWWVHVSKKTSFFYITWLAGHFQEHTKFVLELLMQGALSPNQLIQCSSRFCSNVVWAVWAQSCHVKALEQLIWLKPKKQHCDDLPIDVKNSFLFIYLSLMLQM